MEAIRANRTNMLKDNINMWQDITHINDINKSGGVSLGVISSDEQKQRLEFDEKVEEA